MKTRLAYAVALLSCISCSSNSAVPADGGTGATDGSVGVGVTDGSVADGSANTFATSACGTCVSTSCAAAVTACNGEPECANYWACVGACDVGPTGGADPTCTAACTAPTGSAAVIDQQQLAECQTEGAGSTCGSCGTGGGDGGEDGGILGQSCPNGPGTDTAPCPVCEDDYCCNTYAACHADPECDAFATCDKDCVLASEDAGTFDAGLADAGGLTCDEICYALHPAGLVHFAPRLACLTVYCSTAATCEEGVPASELTCIACQVAHCSHEMATLYGTPDGFLLQDCFNTCGDMAGTPCEKQCVSKYPNISAAWTAFETCATSSCATACD